MKHVTIPNQWTGQQALSTVAFLERVIDAIWRAHGPEMAVELVMPRPRQTTTRRLPPAAVRPRSKDDDILF